MKLCRFDGHRFGIVLGAGVADVTPIFDSLPASRYPYPRHDVMVAALDELRAKLEAAASASPVIPLRDVTLESPVANPGKIIGAPVNYRKHLREVRDLRELHHDNPSHTLEIREIGLFLKATSSLIGPSGKIEIAKPERRNDHEIELAVVIGKEAKNVTARDALGHVAGYAIALDMTVRGSEDRSFRKSLDGYSVLGPWLVTADDIPDPSGLEFELSVNGETRQRGNTADLVLSVPDLIEYASSFYTLHPGDLIFTGTPEGVAPVLPGDRLHVWMDRIGEFSIDVATCPGSLFSAPKLRPDVV